MRGTRAAVAASALTLVMRGTGLNSFAMVMATGIVSAALRQDGLPQPSAVLLVIAAVQFAVLAAVSCWRAAAFPAGLRADLTRPGQAFASFALVAACSVLGSGLASAGHQIAAAVLAGAALAAWLVLTWLIPVRLAVRPGGCPAITEVNGTWYLWAVATQSLAVAAMFLRASGVLPPRPAAVAAIAAWSAGVVLYLVTCGLVLARLLRAAPGRQDARAPWWVAMGCASISVFAAARILHVAGPVLVSAARGLITGVAVSLWALATCLIPVLAALTFPRRIRSPRYQPGLWVIVFPLGMYAAASLQLATATRFPLAHHIGAVAVWPATAAWALTFTAMAVAPKQTQALRKSRGLST